MRVVVIGGGITGLAAAHRLGELAREHGAPVEVRLLEGSERLGGTISTEYRDGFILEGGPDSFITDKPWGLQLCRRIGLDERLIGTNPAYRRSYVVRGGKLHPVPEGFQLLAPTRFWPLATTRIFSWPGKARMALDLLLPPRLEDGDESIGAFVQRRLGREALERMAQPMVGGIYGADPHTLSLAATLPRFLDMERKHGSVIRGMLAARRGLRSQALGLRKGGAAGTAAGDRGVSGARYGLFVSFDQGMQVLVDALAERLPPGVVTRGARVVRLEQRDQALFSSISQGLPPKAQGPTPKAQSAQDRTPEAPVRWRLTLESGETIDADAVCLALPSYHSAALVEGVDPELSALLLQIPYAWAATMNLAYRRADVPHPLDGFGFVVPAREKRTILGCTFSSVKFPGRAPEGQALLRAFLGEPHAAQLSDAEMEAAVREDLRVLLGIRAAPRFATLLRHPNAMAQYTLGHLDRLSAIEERAARIPGLALAGNAYRGIGIPDCVRSGEAAAEALLSRS